MNSNQFKLVCTSILFLLLTVLGYSQTVFRGVVLDAKDKMPVVGVKIGISDQGVGELTNDKGYFAYAKYHKVLSDESILQISAPGYETIVMQENEVRQLLSVTSTIYLEKDRKYKNTPPRLFENVVLYWDVSASSGERNFNKEWEALSSFIKNKEIKNLKVIAFNTEKVWEEAFEINDKSLEQLQHKLSTTPNEGLSNYNSINTTTNEDAVLMVSDGNPMFGEGQFSDNTPVYAIATATSNVSYLKKLSAYTGGEVIYLDDITVKEKPKKNLTTKKIQGKVTSVSGAVHNARILRSGTLDEFYTDAQGNFELDANEGDLIKISYLGMFSKEITLTYETYYDIELIPSNDVLDEVVIKGKPKQEVIVGRRVLEGADGLLGDDLYVIASDIGDHLHTVLDVIRWHFPQVQIKRTDGLPRAFIHQIEGPQELIWFIDGVPGPTTTISNSRSLEANDAFEVVPQIPEYLYAKDIESIILKNAPQLNSKYGVHLGAGDKAIIVTTKQNVLAKEKYDVLVKDNDYTEDVPLIANGVVSDNHSVVSGNVRSVTGPIQGAEILLDGRFDTYYSKADGSFKVPAATGDILKFSYLGMYSKGVLVEDSEAPLQVDLVPIAEVLDEVTLEGKEKEEEKILTAYGKESKDKLGYAVNYLTSEDIPPSAQSVADILRGQFAGVIITGFGLNAKIRLRPAPTLGGAGGSSEVLWDIDNSLITASLSEIDTFLDPHNIASISILKSLTAVNRYGTLGVGGVIVIRTKSSVKLEFSDTQKPRSILVEGNAYDEKVRLLNENKYTADYIMEIAILPTLEAQFSRYREMETSREPSLAFYVDMAQYFQQYDNTLANQVLNELAILGRSNVKVLRVLAYLYEAGHDNVKAQLTYERILKLAPNEAQSYRDLALIYQEVGEYNKALDLYINMLGEQIVGVNFGGLEKPLKNELNHLIALYKDKIEYSRLPNEWLRVGYNVDLRMVIEWSDRNVPFEFQFVNPDKKYFKWTHTLDQNRERLLQEQDQKFQTEEFIIDDTPPGEWLVNIQYLGDADEFALPPYIKYTLYRNYGTPQEKKEIRVIKLYLQEDKVTLSKINL